jgi:hypothetical protein
VSKVQQRFSWKFFGAIVAAGVLIVWGTQFGETAQAQGAGVKTGPAVGERIPSFEAVDHSGKTQTFASLRGPKGLVLLFHRSADW